MDYVNLYIIKTCTQYSIATYIVGGLIFFGAIIGYIPQLITLVKARSVKGFKESSVFLLCLSLSTLTLNALILNWYKWSCFKECGNRWICFLNLLNLFQIGISWVMATVVYVLFIRFRCGRNDFEESDVFISQPLENEQEFIERVSVEIFEDDKPLIPKIVTDWALFGIYVGFTLIVIIISILEKTIYEHKQSNHFFTVFAYILGIISSGASFVVWIPQIVHIIRKQRSEGLNVWMFLVQAPGSIIVVIFQAVIYKQAVITWMPYAINAIEQFIVAGLLIWLKYKKRKEIIQVNETCVGLEELLRDINDIHELDFVI